MIEYHPDEEEGIDLDEYPDDFDESDSVVSYSKALRSHWKSQKAYHEAYDKAEDEFSSSMCSLAVVFLRSTKDLETPSRFETTMERRLRNAIQDLERLQVARKLEAADADTVIDVKHLNKD